VASEFIWIAGTTGSGKTQRLVDQFEQWTHQPEAVGRVSRPILAIAANGENRLEWVDRLLAISGESIDSHTPIGFFQHEVRLFWPLIAESLQLSNPFPLRLRPETEQALATRVMQSDLMSGRLHQDGITDYRMVRRTLDILQLAAYSGTAIADIPAILENGMETDAPDLWHCIGEVLQRWSDWCLERGLLTYGLIAYLYIQQLLPHPTYRANFSTRYRGVLADDVDEYPAIAYDVLTLLMDAGIPTAMTFHPEGSIRLGLGADPYCLKQLSNRCQVELLPSPVKNLGDRIGLDTVWGWIQDPLMVELPASVRSLQTTARGSLLREIGNHIADAVEREEVQPQDIAIIGPGLDAIARYTLREILNNRGIALISLNDQRPLVSSPMVRSLLTLLALVYPGLGRLLNADAVAEMLVVLSQRPTERSPFETAIDPVRAGLLTDHCFVPDPQQPKLLDTNVFPRWDRLGHEATAAYGRIRNWIDQQQQQLRQRLLPNAIALLDRAIQHFFYGGTQLPYDQLSALRELIETTQHYWDVSTRLRQSGATISEAGIVGELIELLQDGTITADPYPVRPLRSPSAVTLSTIFQYRSQRCQHRWHYWLDAGSLLWLTGGGPLFGAPLFLSHWSGRPWTAADAQADDLARLKRQLFDLLARTSDRLYLCHSDLATNGQEQAGPLLPIVTAMLL
jgi:hypothetical protein